MKVRSIKKNMTEIEVKGKRILFSYETPVAVIFYPQLEASVTEEFFSRTTSKHINEWLKLHLISKRNLVSQDTIVELAEV